MNQPVYNPAPYSPSPYPSGEGPQPANQPYPAQPCPAPGYPPQSGAALVYPPSGQAYPAYPAYPAFPMPDAPRFAVQARDPRRLGGRREVTKLSLLIAIQLFLSLALQIIVLSVSLAIGYDLYNDKMGLIWMTIAFSPLTTALPFFAYMFFGKKDWNGYMRFEKCGFFTGLLCVLAGTTVCMLANIPSNYLGDLLERLGARSTPNLLGGSQTWEFFLLEFIGMAVVVPVMEEFTFRGVLLSSLRRYGTGFAVVASGLLFGLAHLNITSVVFASIAGIAMGFLYVKTENLWVTVFIHALNNGLAVIGSNVDLLAGSRAAYFAEAVNLGFLGAGVAAFLLLVIFRRKRIFARRPFDPSQPPAFPPLHAGEALGCLVKSPGFWCLVLLVLVNTGTMFL